MRVAYTSDVHADVSPVNGELLPHLARTVEELAPDVLILAGDVANDLGALDRALAAFEGVRARKLLVPGNHDVWLESKRALRRGHDSWHKYVTAIPEVSARRGFHSLVGTPLVIDGVGFAGSLGWYDYSLRDRRLDEVLRPADYEGGRFQLAPRGIGYWNDVTNAAWLRDPGALDWRLRSRRLANADVFDRIRGLLVKDLARLSGAASLVVALHTAPFEECLVRKTEPDPFDAYEGSLALGELLAREAERRPVTCICGHRHQPLNATVRGVRMLRSPVGYLERDDGPLEAVAARSVGVVDLPGR